MKRTLPIVTVLVALIIAANWQFIPLFLERPYIGRITESWETTNQTFKLRINRHVEENGGFVPGAYFAFQSTELKSEVWREIMIVRLDDPSPIPHDAVGFVNEQIGYVFLGPKYAVTTNGGRSWAVWDATEAKKNMPFEDYKLYPSIEKVAIDPNGHGRMKLYSTSDTDEGGPNLYTQDYGLSWNLK